MQIQCKTALLWLDLEPTGIDFYSDGIRDICYELESRNVGRLDLHSPDRLFRDPSGWRNFMPRRRYKVSGPSAPKYPGQISELSLSRRMARDIKSWGRSLQKGDKHSRIFFAGYNVSQDVLWLKHRLFASSRQDIWSLIDPRTLDVMQAARKEGNPRESGRKFLRYRLGDVCSALGIPIMPHDPESDITATKAIWRGWYCGEEGSI